MKGRTNGTGAHGLDNPGVEKYRWKNSCSTLSRATVKLSNEVYFDFPAVHLAVAYGASIIIP
jgi:hypothetical protein